MILLFLLTLAVVVGSILVVLRVAREPAPEVHAQLRHRAPESRLVALDPDDFARVYARARRKRSGRILLAVYGWIAAGMGVGGLLMALLYREGQPLLGLIAYLAASIACMILGLRHARANTRSLRALMHAELHG